MSLLVLVLTQPVQTFVPYSGTAVRDETVQGPNLLSLFSSLVAMIFIAAMTYTAFCHLLTTADVHYSAAFFVIAVVSFAAPAVVLSKLRAVAEIVAETTDKGLRKAAALAIDQSIVGLCRTLRVKLSFKSDLRAFEEDPRSAQSVRQALFTYAFAGMYIACVLGRAGPPSGPEPSPNFQTGRVPVTK